MTLRLFTIERTPRNLPIWRDILEDLGNPSPRRVAKALGVSVRTIERWNAAEEAPKAACLALFWMTSWGRSEIHVTATNDAIVAAGLARAQKREMELMRHHLERSRTAELETKQRLKVALGTINRAIEAGILKAPGRVSTGSEESQNETQWRGVTKAPPSKTHRCGALKKSAADSAECATESSASPATRSGKGVAPRRQSPTSRPVSCVDPFAQILTSLGPSKTARSGGREASDLEQADDEARVQEPDMPPEAATPASRAHWGVTPSPPKKRAVRPAKASGTRLSEPPKPHPWRNQA